ncbi:hypothetical protein CV102_10355 [Natronococcus pandeyae]|uniref:Uncharacterized protein n=1 Tax=Natronococcus pandeyae TaxID=2055836 RepID=A0A8J8Q2F3_9EURY|nr:hypothetical protein [Natronococcus pandeyae]TYL38900.1 hypothetical protein CV102_10355 [Natronococcus pandeyae]
MRRRRFVSATTVGLLALPAERGRSSRADETATYSNQYDSIQAAVDAAGDGHLYVDDTKEEDDIRIDTDENDGLVIEWLGDSWVEQPADPDEDTHVFEVHGDSTYDLTLVNFRVRNPYNDDEDVFHQLHPDYDHNTDRRSAIELHREDPGPRTFRVLGGHVHHVNGYGVLAWNVNERAVIRDLTVQHTAQDGICVTGATAPDVTVSNCVCEDTGRHSFCFLDEIDTVRCSGVGRRPHTSGVYLEGLSDETDVFLETVIRGAVRAESGPHRRILEWTETGPTVRGSLVGINPQNCQFTPLRATVEDFTLTITRDDGSEHVGFVGDVDEDGAVVDHQEAVRIQDVTDGSATIILEDEGGSHPTEPAITLDNCAGGRFQLNTSNVSGLPVRIDRTRSAIVDVTSNDPWAATDEPFDDLEKTHVHVGSAGPEPTAGNDVRFLGRSDTDGDRGADYALWLDAYSRANRVSGTAYDAYAHRSVLDEGSDNETSDLVS